MRDRPYHILFATTNAELGGGELSLVSLAANLDREKFRCTVLCPAGPLVERLHTNAVDVCPMDVGHFSSYGGVVPKPPWRTLWSVFKYARERHVDVIHAHHYEASKTFGGVARCLGVPALWTCQGFWFSVTGIKGRYLTRVMDHTVAVSEFVKRTLLAGGVLREESISVVHNSVDIEFFAQPLTDGEGFRQRFGIDDSSFVIGVIARLAPVKGHNGFLLALSQVVHQMPGVRALLVGGEILVDAAQEYGDQIRQMVSQLGLTRHVILAGLQNNMPTVYDACDVIVVPSLGEAFGRVVLEAMARQKPVIATDCGGPSEIISHGESGLLVSVGDVDALAEAILQIAREGDLRKSLVDCGYQRVQEEFTVEKMVSSYENLYLRLLGSQEEQR